ncbi:MAG: hypothetical protein Q9194_003024 [Teloschistes cf. exilis]
MQPLVSGAVGQLGRANAPAPADSIIDVPGVEELTESQRTAVFKKAEAITPPPDKEEDDEECRVLEAQARQDLESDGCAPCYPPHLAVPVHSPPDEYRQIIDYWKSFSSTEDVVLCAQRSDWRDFRQAQQILRHRYRNKPFTMFVDEIRSRRRGHGLDDNTWIEFQDYHLKLHERQEKKRDEILKELDNTQKEEAGNMVMEGSEHASMAQERPFHRGLEFAERTLRWHELMLSWIEQCRLETAPLPPTPVEQGSSDQSSSSNRQRRSKRPNTPAVLGKVRVSKSMPKGQNVRTRKIKATESTPISVDSAVTRQSSSQQTSKRREMKPRRAKEKALGQLLSQRVAKVNRFADTGAKSRSRTQSSSDGQIRHRAKPRRR